MALPLPLITDPKDLLLGPDNDLVITNDLQFSRGVQAIVQSARIALQMFEEEWFLNLGAGMPYWQRILAQKPEVAKKAISISARAALLEIQGVIDVTRLEVEYVGATRKLRLRWQVKTAFGETPVDEIALRTGGSA